MSQTITYSEVLETTRCWCGIALAIPQNLLRHAHNDGQVVYCPLGHKFSWSETEADRLRKSYEDAQAKATRLRAMLDQERADAASLNRRLSAAKGQITKARKRAVAAMCPVPGCHRELIQMKRHLASKHAEWLAEHDHDVTA